VEPHALPERPPQAGTASRSLGQTAFLVVVVMVAYVLLPLRGELWWLGALICVAVLVLIVPITVRRLRRVQASNQPWLDAIQAVVLIVSLLIFGFSAAYYAMNRNGSHFNGLDTRVDAVYFTVTTLSTVGYGDISATSQAARVLVTVAIIVNLAFLGIAVRAFAGAADRAARRRSQ
jgi:voltage-gated potassium channel